MLSVEALNDLNLVPSHDVYLHVERNTWCKDKFLSLYCLDCRLWGLCSGLQHQVKVAINSQLTLSCVMTLWIHFTSHSWASDKSEPFYQTRMVLRNLNKSGQGSGLSYELQSLKVHDYNLHCQKWNVFRRLFVWVFRILKACKYVFSLISFQSFPYFNHHFS